MQFGGNVRIELTVEDDVLNAKAAIPPWADGVVCDEGKLYPVKLSGFRPWVFYRKKKWRPSPHTGCPTLAAFLDPGKYIIVTEDGVVIAVKVRSDERIEYKKVEAIPFDMLREWVKKLPRYEEYKKALEEEAKSLEERIRAAADFI